MFHHYYCSHILPAASISSTSPLGVHNRRQRVGVADGNAIKIRKSNEIMCIYIYVFTLTHTRSTIKYVDCLTTSIFICGRIRVLLSCARSPISTAPKHISSKLYTKLRINYFLFAFGMRWRSIISREDMKSERPICQPKTNYISPMILAILFNI